MEWGNILSKTTCICLPLKLHSRLNICFEIYSNIPGNSTCKCRKNMPSIIEAFIYGGSSVFMRDSSYLSNTDFLVDCMEPST